MNRDDARRLLDRIGVLKHAADLDLLVFFGRHPRALVTSEQLAAWLGYESKQVAESLELLLDAGLLTRSQNRTHAARMYIFAVGGSGEWLPTLLKLVSTRAGRLAVREELSLRATNPPRPFVVSRQSHKTSAAKAG